MHLVKLGVPREFGPRIKVSRTRNFLVELWLTTLQTKCRLLRTIRQSHAKRRHICPR